MQPLAFALATLLSTAVQPVASPAPSEPPLREIGRVHVTTPLCIALATDASTAIDKETFFDQRLIDAEVALHAADFDSSPIAKARATTDVRARYVELAATIASSRATMKTFAQRLKDAPTQAARDNLQSFANALSGALHKQQSLADELGRFLAFVDTHEPLDANAHADLEIAAQASANDARFSHDPYQPLVPPQLSGVAKDASTMLAKRAEPLALDEQTAADRIEAAFSGC
jgi:hypothetical protein